MKIFFQGLLILMLLGCGGGGSSSTPTIKTPQFVSPNEVTVEEEQPHAITLEGNNSHLEQITYGIGDGDSDSFNIDDLTGEVTFKTLPKYTEKSVYRFRAYAEYSIETITQDVTIYIAKKGTIKELTFTSPNYVNIYENQTKVIDLEAVGNGEIVYSIQGEDANYFTVDQSTGLVKFKEAPVYETKSLYTFTAVASDNSDEVTLSITISIQDIDESSLSQEVKESDYFITTWKTDNNGSSNDNQVMIQTYPYSAYNYHIDWGDGSSNSGVTGDITHTYSKIGTYSIKISGDFPRIQSNGYSWSSKIYEGDAEKLLSIDQWGTIKWESMHGAFSGCINMVGNFSDIPDLTNVTEMTNMFYRAELFNSDIGDWDVSSVTRMYAMFNVARSFNQDISQWNVSQVTDMGYMFGSADYFNQNISNWDVSKVTDMSGMFNGADFFNQDIGQWNVSSVTQMENMFGGASSFNQDISSWDVSKVENMKSMFNYAKSFNQDLGDWDISSVKTITTEYEYSSSKGMDKMFQSVTLSTTNYNSILNSWSSQIPNKGIELHGGNSKYSSSAEAGRNRLLNEYGWIIRDGGKE